MFVKLLKKELRELINTSLILSMVFFFMIYGFMGMGFEKANEAVKKRPEIVLVGSGKLADYLKERAKIVEAKDVESAIEIAKEKNISAVFKVDGDSNVEVIWLVKGFGILDAADKGPIENLLVSLKEMLKNEILKKNGLSPSELEDVLKVKEITIVKGKRFDFPFETVAQSLFNYSMFQPMLIAFIVSFAGSSLTSAISMERTQKTLETLLTLPIRRINIALSKLVASSIVGIMLGFAYMAGFSFYMSKTAGEFQNSPNLNLITSGDVVLSSVSLITALYSGLTLCLLVGIFAKDVKTAATLSFPVSMMGFIPMIIGIFKDLDTLPLPLSVALSLIPFTHPIFSMRFLAFDMKTPVYLGILYNLALGFILTVLVWKVFESDTLVLGRISKKR